MGIINLYLLLIGKYDSELHCCWNPLIFLAGFMIHGRDCTDVVKVLLVVNLVTIVDC